MTNDLVEFPFDRRTMPANLIVTLRRSFNEGRPIIRFIFVLIDTPFGTTGRLHSRMTLRQQRTATSCRCRTVEEAGVGFFRLGVPLVGGLPGRTGHSSVIFIGLKIRLKQIPPLFESLSEERSPRSRYGLWHRWPVAPGIFAIVQDLGGQIVHVLKFSSRRIIMRWLFG